MLNRLINMVIHPRETLAEIAHEQPFQESIIFVAIILMLNTLETTFSFQMNTGGSLAKTAFDCLLVVFIMGLIFFTLLCLAMCIVAEKLFNGSGDWKTVVSCTAYTYAPFAISIICGFLLSFWGGIGMVLGELIYIVAAIWSIVLIVFGLQESMNLDLKNAIITFILAAIIGGIIYAIFVYIGIASGVLISFPGGQLM